VIASSVSFIVSAFRFAIAGLPLRDLQSSLDEVHVDLGRLDPLGDFFWKA
jgi:hypothetical protein